MKFDFDKWKATASEATRVNLSLCQREWLRGGEAALLQVSVLHKPNLWQARALKPDGLLSADFLVALVKEAEERWQRMHRPVQFTPHAGR